MIKSLPSQLGELYMRILSRIKPVYKSDAVRYLQFVLHSELDGYYPMDLCALYFISHSQGEMGDSPFIDREIYTSELLAACRTLKARLLSHTAGLLELTPASPRSGHKRMHCKEQNFDPLLFTGVTFFHRTVRDFPLDNAEFKSGLAPDGMTEAQARLSIARGILAQVAHFAQGDAQVVDKYWPNPVYKPLRASLQQISLAERSLGAAQVKLMHSLDFASFARGYLLTDDITVSYFGSVEAFVIENVAETAVDIVGMATAVGMTLFVCEQLGLPIESRRCSPSLPSPDAYSNNRAAAATLRWKEVNES